MNYTPGPWQIDRENRAIVGPNGERIVRYEGIAQWQAGQGKANAHLIAAAPALVEALGIALDLFEGIPQRLRLGDNPKLIERIYPVEITKIRDTLALAKGEKNADTQ